MAFKTFRTALFALLLLTGCAPAPWDDPLDVTELLRLSPEDFRMQSVIPAGLDTTGQAEFRWRVLNPDGSEEFFETFTLERIDSTIDANGDRQVTFALQRADLRRFQTQQIRQRAQLLAGVFQTGLSAGPILCDRAGVPARAQVVYSIIRDGRTGNKVTTLRTSQLANALEREAPFCV